MLSDAEGQTGLLGNDDSSRNTGGGGGGAGRIRLNATSLTGFGAIISPDIATAAASSGPLVTVDLDGL